MSTSLKQANRLNLIVLLSSTLLMAGTRQMWYRLVPLHLRTLGATTEEVGLVYTISLLLGPIRLIGGFVSDRRGRRFAISIPTLILVPILFLTAGAQHWLVLAAAFWLIAIFGGIQQPGFQAMLAESATDQDRGKVWGGFHAVQAIAAMLGPALGALLLDRINIHGLIIINAIGALISGLIRLLFLREGQFAVSVDHAPNNLNIRSVFRNKFILPFILINSLYLLLIFGLTGEGPFIALHAADAFAMNETAINRLFAIGGIGAIIASVLGGTLTDKLGGRVVAAGGLILHVILLIAWGLSRQIYLNYALFGLCWVMLQIGIVGYSAWFSAFSPPEIRGRILGLVGAIGTFSSAIGTQAGTWIRTASTTAFSDQSGLLMAASAAPFALSLGVVIVFVFLILKMPAEQQKDDQPHTVSA